MGKKQIKVEGTTLESHDSLMGIVKTDKAVEAMRAYMVNYFFFCHGDLNISADDADDADDDVDGADGDGSFSFLCNTCDQHTLYYRKPIETFRAPLCLSTPCLTKLVRAQITPRDPIDEEEVKEEENEYS